MAAPETERKDQASELESPAAQEAAAVPPPKPAPRRTRGLLSRLFLSILLLLAILGVAGYGALTFRDADPRVGLAANYVEEGLTEAQRALDQAQGIIADLTGSPEPAPKTPARRALLDKAPLPPDRGQPPAEIAPEPDAPAPAETAKEPETAAVEETAPEPKSEPAPEPPQKSAEAAQEPAPAPALPAPAEVAAPAPVEAPKPAAPVEAVDADGFTDRDLISALEGRIDALSDQLQALRERLDAPKSEARAAPDMKAPKSEAEPAAAPAPAPAGVDASAAAVVVAVALQRNLEAGRPFAEEIAALSRLSAEPAPEPILIELAEKGVPTGAQLHDAFLPVAKKLKAHETHRETHGEAAQEGDIAGHLLQGASKLVKVRPTGQAAPESLDGKVERIEAALGRGDFATAESLFDSLPDHAKAEAKDFGETLHRRNEAAKAADDLLRGAIAALGKK